MEVQAPLGTSVEFNYVANPHTVDLANLAGSYIPFHKTRAAREAAGDTRPSLQELYGDQQGYVRAVKTAADSLVRQRFLLWSDAAAIVEKASRTRVLDDAQPAKK